MLTRWPVWKERLALLAGGWPRAKSVRSSMADLVVATVPLAAELRPRVARVIALMSHTSGRPKSLDEAEFF